MGWQDKLQPASFRGVPFQVEGDDLSAGRRVQVHEYPQRDKPYAEDLGRATREINLTAFVIGADYMAARDRLLAACEEAGPGTLVHPWYGSLQVVLKSCRVSQGREDGGLARFTLAFVEAGELSFPKGTESSAAQVKLAAAALNSAAVADFSAQFSVDGQPGWVSDAALSDFSGALDTLDGALRAISGWQQSAVSLLKGDISGLLGEPGALALRAVDLFRAIPTVGERYASLAGMVRTLTAGSKNYPASTTVAATPALRQQVQNANAVQALMRRAQLAQAATAVAEMPLPVYEEAIELRADLAAALDAEAMAASDAAYPALADLRVKVHKDIAARSRDSARLDTVTPAEPMPALALAYDLYEDAGRDAEVVERNRIRHPGFVPAEPLLVLSK